MRKNAIIFIAVIIVVIVAVVYAIQGGKNDVQPPSSEKTIEENNQVEQEQEQIPSSEASSKETASPQAVQTPSPNSGEPSRAQTAEVKEFTVIATNFKFSINEMRVKQGDTVRITLVSEEGFHDVRVDEFSAATAQIQAGSQETIEFVVDKTGEFEYYCSIGEHRKMGMKGMLIVE